MSKQRKVDLSAMPLNLTKMHWDILAQANFLSVELIQEKQLLVTLFNVSLTVTF